MKKYLFIVVLFLLLLVTIFSIISCSKKKQSSKSLTTSDGTNATLSGKSEEIIIKLSHPSGAISGDPIHESAVLMQRLLEEKSNRKIKVVIYPGGQLGSESRNVQDVQNGIVEMAMITAGNMISYSPSFGVLDFPYLFQSREEAWKAIDAISNKFTTLQVNESGTRTIAWLEQGFRNITNSKREIKSLADLQGLKIRVPNNKFVISAFKSWDINPVPIAWDEVFSSLQQGVVDGQENPYVSIYVHKMYEMQKYVTDIHYKIWVGVFIINEDWFQKISSDLQKVILQVGKQITQFNRDMIVKTEKETRQKLIDNGMILSGTPSDEQEWAKRAMSVWPQFYDALPDISILDEVMTAVGRKRP